MRFLVLFFTLLVLNTNEYKTSVNQKSYQNSASCFDSIIPFRFLPLDEQLEMAPKEKIFLGNILKRISPTYYEGVDEKAGLVLKEFYPGVVGVYTNPDDNTSKVNREDVVKIEFYDSLGRVFNEILIDDYVPKDSLPFEYGYPFFEVNKPGKTNESNPVTSRFINVRAEVSRNGAVFIIETAWLICQDKSVCGETNSIFCYDEKGEVITKVEVEGELRSVWLSENRDFLVVMHGRDDEQVLNQSHDGIDIYSIENTMSEMVFSWERKPRQVLVGFSELSLDKVKAGVNDMLATNFPQMVIDFTERKAYYVIFSKEEVKAQGFETNEQVLNYLVNHEQLKIFKF